MQKPTVATAYLGAILNIQASSISSSETDTPGSVLDGKYFPPIQLRVTRRDLCIGTDLESMKACAASVNCFRCVAQSQQNFASDPA